MSWWCCFRFFTAVVIFVCLNTSLGSYWHTLESMYSDEMNHLEDKLSGMGWKVGRTGRIRQAADRSLFMCRSRIWKSWWRISANEYCMPKGGNDGRFTSSKGGNHAISRLEFYKKGMIRFRIMPFVVWETTIEGKRQATFREKRYGSSPGDFVISVDLPFPSYREEYPMPVDSALYSFRNWYKP